MRSWRCWCVSVWVCCFSFECVAVRWCYGSATCYLIMCPSVSGVIRLLSSDIYAEWICPHNGGFAVFEKRAASISGNGDHEDPQHSREYEEQNPHARSQWIGKEIHPCFGKRRTHFLWENRTSLADFVTMPAFVFLSFLFIVNKPDNCFWVTLS